MKDEYIIHVNNMCKLCNKQYEYKRWSLRVAQVTAVTVA